MSHPQKGQVGERIFQTDWVGGTVAGSIRTRISQKPLVGGIFLLFLDAALKYAIAESRPDLLCHHQGIVVGHPTNIVGGGLFV